MHDLMLLSWYSYFGVRCALFLVLHIIPENFRFTLGHSESISTDTIYVTLLNKNILQSERRTQEDVAIAYRIDAWWSDCYYWNPGKMAWDTYGCNVSFCTCNFDTKGGFTRGVVSLFLFFIENEAWLNSTKFKLQIFIEPSETLQRSGRVRRNSFEEKKILTLRRSLTFFDLITLESLMVSAWNLVCGRFIKFERGRKILTLLAFGCSSDDLAGLHKSQVHCAGVMQWWACSSLMSAPLSAEAGCETCERIVLMLFFVS